MVTESVRQLCVLWREGWVRVTDTGALPRLTTDDAFLDPERLAAVSVTAGDPDAVLIAPTRRVQNSLVVMVNVLASRDDRSEPSGPWVRPDELDESPEVIGAILAAVQEWSGLVPAPAERPGWYRPGWYEQVEEWIDSRLPASRPRTGPVVPVKVWSLSAVLRVPTSTEPVWLKASCEHFGAEPALTALAHRIDPRHTPSVIAADGQRRWLLTDHLSGATEERLGQDAAASAGAAIAGIQTASLDRLAEIRAAGAADRGLDRTRTAFDAILDDGFELDQLSAEELAAARSTRGQVRANLDRLAAFGVPDTLVHGDLHTANVAVSADGVVLYDWSDAALGQPMLDLVLLVEKLDPPAAAAARAAFVDHWRSVRPDLDIEAALRAARPVTWIHQLVSYEQISRAQEPAARWELSGVAAGILRRLPDTQSQH